MRSGRHVERNGTGFGLEASWKTSEGGRRLLGERTRPAEHGVFLSPCSFAMRRSRSSSHRASTSAAEVSSRPLSWRFTFTMSSFSLRSSSSVSLASASAFTRRARKGARSSSRLGAMASSVVVRHGLVEGSQDLVRGVRAEGAEALAPLEPQARLLGEPLLLLKQAGALLPVERAAPSPAPPRWSRAPATGEAPRAAGRSRGRPRRGPWTAP
jgi:hypothetical protein